MIFDQFSFSTLRLLAIYIHFILTSFLFWTRFDSLQVVLSPNSSKSDFDKIEGNYTGLISFGLFLIIVELIVFSMDYNKKSLSSALHLLLDYIACFFVAWIILDGLDWKSYIYILVFCLIVPVSWDVIASLLQIYRQIWVRSPLRNDRGIVGVFVEWWRHTVVYCRRIASPATNQ